MTATESVELNVMVLVIVKKSWKALTGSEIVSKTSTRQYPRLLFECVVGV